jgi:hypothetical protein
MISWGLNQAKRAPGYPTPLPLVNFRRLCGFAAYVALAPVDAGDSASPHSWTPHNYFNACSLLLVRPIAHRRGKRPVNGIFKAIQMRGIMFGAPSCSIRLGAASISMATERRNLWGERSPD